MDRRTFLASATALPLEAITGIGSNVGSTPTVQPVAASGFTRFTVFTEKEFAEVGRSNFPMLIIDRLLADGFNPYRPLHWEHDLVNRVWIAAQENT